MDSRTVQYYDDNAEAVYARYQGAKIGIARYFRLAFPPGSVVLDIGAGSGRDLDTLLHEECEAYGAEPSARLREVTESKLPHLAGRIYAGSLPGLSKEIDRRFDGILCSGIFMHIPEEQLFDAAFDIRNLLKPNGRLLLSITADRGGLDEFRRDQYGRLHTRLVPESLELLFERLGFQRIGKWKDEDSLGREGITWITLLFVLGSDQPHRPIDQIEGVLNRDRKVATYKLALFRALCDIALTNYHLAEWRPDGTVGIPIREIAERWIYYYWPLLEDESNFIPQIRGESRAGRLQIGFRPHLRRLIASFQNSGGLDAFAVAIRNDALDGSQRQILDATLKRLVPVIKEGPVTHAGRSSIARQLFGYDGRLRHMIVSGDIWRELCLSGHWIQDALILRWAELTSEISKNAISPSEVIDRLLRLPVRERNVMDARRVYLELPSKECVWSGVSLGRRFDVDHVLPFSLWRNNDLWNLLPTSPLMNRDKGDSLPTNLLLKRRKGVIMCYWDALHQANPRRFEYEISRLAGGGQKDFSKVFNVMLEAVEVTALQRGCLRWEP